MHIALTSSADPNHTISMPVETAAAYHYNTHKHQGVLSRQVLSANPTENHSSTILVDKLYSDAAQLYFGLESSIATHTHTASHTLKSLSKLNSISICFPPKNRAHFAV